MNKKQFADKYCTKCGSQRCEGVNSEWVDGCGHWKKEMGGLNLVEKAMDNKGIDLRRPSIDPFKDKLYGALRKRASILKDQNFLVKDLMEKLTRYFMCGIDFESMNEEVEC